MEVLEAQCTTTNAPHRAVPDCRARDFGSSVRSGECRFSCTTRDRCTTRDARVGSNSLDFCRGHVRIFHVGVESQQAFFEDQIVLQLLDDLGRLLDVVLEQRHLIAERVVALEQRVPERDGHLQVILAVFEQASDGADVMVGLGHLTDAITGRG